MEKSKTISKPGAVIVIKTCPIPEAAQRAISEAIRKGRKSERKD